jgi:hypothetical protein
MVETSKPINKTGVHEFKLKSIHGRMGLDTILPVKEFDNIPLKEALIELHKLWDKSSDQDIPEFIVLNIDDSEESIQRHMVYVMPRVPLTVNEYLHMFAASTDTHYRIFYDNVFFISKGGVTSPLVFGEEPPPSEID